MRVAYVCADLGVPCFGSKGCSIHVQEIVRSFLNRGDEVEMFVARPGGSCDAFLPVKVHEFSPRRCDDTAAREIAAQEVAERIQAALMVQSPFDLVYERHSLWSAAGPRFARQVGIPSILEINAPLIREQRKHRELVNSTLAFEKSQLAFASASSLAAVSEEVAQTISQDFEIDLKRLHVILNGVDTQRFAPSVPALAPADVFTIGFVGSLKPWHGVETLLEAFDIFHRDFPQSRLLIIGDGPMRQHLIETYCSPDRELSKHMNWIGSVSPNDVPGYLTSMDVAVAPYPAMADFYFSPLKVFEYMACGVATVASHVGQLSKLISNGVDGFLYNPHAADLAKTLRFLAEQETVRREVGIRARKRAVDEFSWDQVLARSLATVNLGADPCQTERGEGLNSKLEQERAQCR